MKSRLLLIAKGPVAWVCAALVDASEFTDARSRILADGSKDCFAASCNREMTRRRTQPQRPDKPAFGNAALCMLVVRSIGLLFAV